MVYRPPIEAVEPILLADNQQRQTSGNKHPTMPPLLKVPQAESEYDAFNREHVTTSDPECGACCLDKETPPEVGFLPRGMKIGCWEETRVELSKLSSLAIPLSTQLLFAQGAVIISTSAAGHLGSWELSVTALAQSFFNVMGTSIVYGMGGGVDTLGGQAFGAGRYRLVGVVLQRALLVNVLVVLLIFAAWVRMDSILLLFGQGKALAAGSAHYLQLLMPALAFLSVSTCLQRYLQAQGSVLVPTAAQILGTFLSPLFLYAYIVRWGLGLDGLAITNASLQATSLVLLLGYCIYRERSLKGTGQQTWHGWSSESLQKWGQYLGLALPSTGLLCMEWWSFESNILLSGLLPGARLNVGVMGMCLNITSMVNMVPRGIAGAVSTRVSNELGAGDWFAARRAAWLCALLTFCVLCAPVSMSVLLQDQIPRIFSSQRIVLDATSELMPYVALSMFGNGINGSLQGVLRGTGTQAIGAVMSFVTFWVIGLPLSYALAFKLRWGMVGLWVARATVTTLQSTCMLVLLYFLDWKSLSVAAAKRVIGSRKDIAVTTDETDLSEPLLESGRDALSG